MKKRGNGNDEPAMNASPAPASSTTSLAADALEVVPVCEVRQDAPVIVRRSSSSEDELGVGDAWPINRIPG